MEADYPFHFIINKSEQNFGVKSIGFDNFNGQLTHNCSAHPKVDRKTGQFMIFGYDLEQPIVHYSLLDEHKKL